MRFFCFNTYIDVKTLAVYTVCVPKKSSPLMTLNKV